MGLLLATCDIVQVFVVIRFPRNLLTEITVKTWVNGAVWVSAHADILCFLLNFQTLQLSSVQPVSPVQIPCRAYFCVSEAQTEWRDAYLYICAFLNFFLQCPLVLFVSQSGRRRVSDLPDCHRPESTPRHASQGVSDLWAWPGAWRPPPQPVRSFGFESVPLWRVLGLSIL